MASITIKDIPEELYHRFKEVAVKDRRSVNAEVIVAMDRLIQETEQRQLRAAALARINERRRQRPRDVVDSLALLREDRDR
ncbi:MAG: FitA-like ribbon-helix-helix domain-containing protein [Armatimonadota bacterium]